MNAPGAPLRFLTLLLALWIGGRGLWLWQERPVNTPVMAPSSQSLHPAVITSVRGGNRPQVATTKPGPGFRHPRHKNDFEHHIRQLFIASNQPLEKIDSVRLAPHAEPPFAAIASQSIDPAIASAGLTPVISNRWSASLWLFGRHGSDAALATSGQLGGSQAGGRIRWRINSAGSTATALTARLSTPLDNLKGAEASIGAEWHPLAAQPLWIAVERRVALGTQGRNAWSAYAAGGIWKPDLPGGAILDGYGQAGVVGAQKHDFFADGAMRVTLPVKEDGGIRIGAGIWGAAQPHVSRLDVGPHVAIPIKREDQHLILAIDMRFRVAGNAAPGSGVAATLGIDF